LDGTCYIKVLLILYSNQGKNYKENSGMNPMANFKKLQQAIKSYDSEREKLIKQSRVVLKLSKQLIYSIHRGESASQLAKDIEREKKDLDILAAHSKKMSCEGSFKVAIQEYVEAILYFNFIKTGKLIDLKVAPEHYVLGLADLPGELVRKAVFLAGKGEVDKVAKIKEVVDNIYGELLAFDFRDNETRRKVDAVKYDLRKLEDLVLDLKLKGR
jgi:predicted translin family RNA/ssDNA-binding protein